MARGEFRIQTVEVLMLSVVAEPFRGQCLIILWLHCFEMLLALARLNFGMSLWILSIEQLHLHSRAASQEHVEEFNDLSSSQDWKVRLRVCWIHTTQFVLWSWSATKQDLCAVPDLQVKRDKHLDNLNRFGQSGCSGCIFTLMAAVRQGHTREHEVCWMF